MAVLGYVGRRLLYALGVVLVLITVTFFLTRAVAEPVNVILGPNADEDQRAQLEHELGLDKPILVQFGDYMSGLLRGDFGESLWQGQPALPLILERLGPSLLLAGTAALLATVLGLALGIMGGLRPGSWLDRLSIVVSAITVAIPDFWLGLILIIVFSVELGWLPTAGYGTPQQLILPALALALVPAGRLARVARESITEEMGKQYVLAARAKGMSTRQIVLRHVLKNVAIAASTVIGYEFLLTFTGYSATLEVVFGWPGVGQLAVEATLQEDIVLMSALVVVAGVIISVGYALIDLMHAAIDRRIEV